MKTAVFVVASMSNSTTVKLGCMSSSKAGPYRLAKYVVYVSISVDVLPYVVLFLKPDLPQSCSFYTLFGL